VSSSPQDWLRAGIDDAARVSFQEWKIPLADAVKWRSVGVMDGLTAVRWSLAGASPPESQQWRAVGIDSIEALQWHQVGFDLNAATAQKRLGNNPSTARGSSRQARSWGGPDGRQLGPAFQILLETDHSTRRQVHFYLMDGWTGDDAVPWAQADISPGNAKMWLMLGLRAAEAAELEKRGVTVGGIVQQWWAAGIPLDQVAAWLGAGFTAVEAAEQIAAGVDAERAAVLRALREGTDE